MKRDDEMTYEETRRNIIREYRSKNLLAQQKAEEKRRELDEKFPDIARIDDALSETGLKILRAALDGKDGLDEKIAKLRKDNETLLSVRASLLASKGYPVSYEKGFVINGLEKFEGQDSYFCFHAGTKQTEQGLVTNGGRVLGITAKGADLKEARANAYAATEWVSFENKYMRHDIGKAIDEA